MAEEPKSKVTEKGHKAIEQAKKEAGKVPISITAEEIRELLGSRFAANPGYREAFMREFTARKERALAREQARQERKAQQTAQQTAGTYAGSGQAVTDKDTAKIRLSTADSPPRSRMLRKKGGKINRYARGGKAYANGPRSAKA